MSLDDRASASVQPPSGPRDDRLHAARRIDWRFLLGSPDLGRVRVIGAPDPWLERGLHEAAHEVRLGSAAPAGSADQPFDTAIVTGRPSRDALREAARSVATSGRLVIEVDLGGPTRVVAPGTAVRLARSLRADGWHVTTWWAWPVRSRLSMWARADDPIALRALGSRLGRPRGPLVGGIAGVLGRSGAGQAVLVSTVPSITIVGERGDGPAGFIQRRVGTEDGVLLLTPRYRASGHVIGMGLDREGQPSRVVKVSRLPGEGTLAHEAAVLRALETVAPGSGPRVLDEDTSGDLTSVVETGLPGRPLDPTAVRRDRAGAVRAVVDWLATLPIEPASARKTSVRERLESALDTILEFERAAPGTTDLVELVDRTRPFVDALEGADLPRVFEHGDPAHPNLIVLENGRLAAVDWERGEPDGLPLSDLTIALAYVASSVARATTPVEQASAFATVTAGVGWAAQALDAEAQRCGIDPALRPALVAMAWMRSLAWFADALGRRDAAAEAVPWLASERAAHHWRQTLRTAGGDRT
jgi:aminoglycoside phosphotransferase